MLKVTIQPATIILVLLFSIPVRAEITGAHSLEWLACAAEVVAVGYLKEVREIKGHGEESYEDCTLAVTELLKSSTRRTEVTFTFRRFKHHPSMADWLRNGTELLVFLSISKNHGLDKHLEGALVPTSMSYPLSLVNLAEPGKYLIDTKFNLLESGREVFEATRYGLQVLNDYQLSGGSTRVEMLSVEVPFDTEAHRALYAGSACYLNVPNFMAPSSRKKGR